MEVKSAQNLGSAPHLQFLLTGSEPKLLNMS